MIEPAALAQRLYRDSLFKDWKKQHSSSYLSHLFCRIDAKSLPKTPWELGFYDAKTERITVFIPLEKDDFQIKPEDQVFKKEKEPVEELVLKANLLSIEEAIKISQSELPNYFPAETHGEGFLILQNLNQKTIWNFSFITKSLKFINLKIEAYTGKVLSSEDIKLVQGWGRKTCLSGAPEFEIIPIGFYTQRNLSDTYASSKEGNQSF